MEPEPSTKMPADNQHPDEKPSQLRFVRPAHLVMFANVVCDPPLGQVTVISAEQNTVCLLSKTTYSFLILLTSLGYFHGISGVWKVLP